MATSDTKLKDGQTVPRGAVRHYADGGLIDSFKRTLGMGPAETISEKYARQDAERAARAPKPAPTQNVPAPTSNAISDYAGMNAMQRREKAAGMKAGGAVRHHPVGKIVGKGTGTSDQVPIDASNGEFLIKTAAVKKIGLETLEALNAIADKPDERDSKAEKLKEYGDTESKSEDMGEKPGMEMREKMGMKCGGAVRKMAGGGLVEDQGGYLPNESVMGRAGRRVSEVGAGFLGGMKSLGQAMNLGAPGAATGMPFNASAGAGRGAVPAGTQVGINESPPVAPPSAIPVAAAATAPAQPGSPAAIAAGATSLVSTPAKPVPATAVASPTQPSPGQVAKTVQPNGVTSYSGANITGDVSLTGNRGGVISAQNNQAAENLARAGGQTSGSGPSGAVRGSGQVSSMDTSAGYAADLKQLAGIEAAKAEQNANMQAQADYAQNKVLEGRAQNGNRGALRILESNAKTKTEQRGQDIQAGATRETNRLAQERLGLDAAKNGREATSADISNRAAQRVEALQLAYDKAKPEDRAALADQIRMLSGKDRPNKYTVSRGGQVYDEKADAMVNQPDRVFDNQTGTWIDQAGQKATPQFEIGKVHEDANGNKATWDGVKWTTVK